MISHEMLDSVPDAAPHWTSPPSEKLLSRSEAARYLGVPVSTIYHWAKTGRLPCQATLGGHLRFARADLDAAYVTSVRFSDGEARRNG